MHPDISVVVPLFNEEDNVGPLTSEILGVLDGMAGLVGECLLVNDGSRDATRARVEAAAAADSRVRAVHLRRNSGQSAAVIAGMRRARGESIVTLDGDGQNDPADIPRLVALLKESDCVCGYRASRQDTWVRRLSSRVGNTVRNAVLHDGIRDSGCGAKAFRRSCVEHLVPFNGSHRFIAAQLRAAGMRIVECPVNHRPRLKGQSKYGINNRLWRGLYDLIGVGWLTRRYVRIEVEE